MGFPPKQGLYDPANEHDSCGVGFVANIKGRKSHEVIEAGLQILVNLDHRGAVGADPLVGDGAGILIQIPDGPLSCCGRKARASICRRRRICGRQCFLPRDEEARAPWRWGGAVRALPTVERQPLLRLGAMCRPLDWSRRGCAGRRCR
jgi:glutamate synthase (NADPH/NADH) large chain